MAHRVHLQPAYVLYTRLFRETSLLLEAFTQDYGRISLVARSIRGAACGLRTRFRGLLQPFTPLLLSWQGSTELVTLTLAEANGISPLLQGQYLIYGLYLNELLSRLLHRFDAHPELFLAYQKSLQEITQYPQVSLRRFEKILLTTLGFAPCWHREGKTGDAVKPDEWYYFQPGQGLLRCDFNFGNSSTQAFRGSSLLALQREQFSQPGSLSDARRLLRLILDDILGGIAIRSRELIMPR